MSDIIEKHKNESDKYFKFLNKGVEHFVMISAKKGSKKSKKEKPITIDPSFRIRPPYTSSDEDLMESPEMPFLRYVPNRATMEALIRRIATMKSDKDISELYKHLGLKPPMNDDLEVDSPEK